MRLRHLPEDAPVLALMQAEHEKAEGLRKTAAVEDVLARFKRKG